MNWIQELRAKPLRLIPYSVRRHLLDALLEDMPYEAMNGPHGQLLRRHTNAAVEFARYAKAIGVSSAIAKGRWGAFQSAASDTIVLPIYGASGSWEDPTNELLISFFKNTKGIYLDIGANIGLTTIPVAGNENVRCVCFEPDPTNYVNLLENIRNNNRNGNIEANNVALFDKACTLSFVLSSDNMGDHRVASASDADRQTITVPAIALDSLELWREEHLAIKIDVQGAEPAVMAGGIKTFEAAELVVLEFTPYMIGRLGLSPAIILDYVRRFPYAAVLAARSDRLQFLDGNEASRELRDFYMRSQGDEYLYVDVFLSKKFSLKHAVLTS